MIVSREIEMGKARRGTPEIVVGTVVEGLGEGRRFEVAVGVGDGGEGGEREP